MKDRYSVQKIEWLHYTGSCVQYEWYFDIIRIYIEEHEKYDELLRKVRAMSVPDTKEQKSFDVWLAENYSSNAASIKSSINILTLLLLKNKIIQNSILKILNIEQIESIINRIKNKRINIHSKRQKNNDLVALGTYKEYLEYIAKKENSKPPNNFCEENNISGSNATVKEDRVFQVSFTESRTYKYTHPSSLDYFEEHYSVKSWAQIYVQAVKCLYKDFPDKIRSLINLSLSGNRRIDVTDSVGADAMITPKKISDSIYLETNESAATVVTKVRKLLDICDVGYENMVIIYSAPKTAQANNIIPSIKTQAKDISFYTWMTQSQGMAKTTGKSYASAINIADEFAEKHHIGYGRIYGTADYRAVQETADALLHTPEFIELDQRQHNRFHAALRKYLQYLSTGNSINISEPVEDSFENVNFEPYRTILCTYFPKGFRIFSRLEMGRFHAFWFKRYGSELTTDDDTVRKYITHITVKYQDFVYLPESMLDKRTAEQMLTYLADCFRDGKHAVYFDAIYKEFQNQFAKTCINNPDMLKSYLTYINDGRFYIRRSYLTDDADVEVNPTDEVKNYLITAGVPVTVEKLKETLSHIDEDRIMWAVAGNDSAEFVRNQKGEYFHADIVHFTQPEISTITDLIQQAIDDKDYMGGKELTDAIDVKLPGIKERYPFLTWLGLRDVIAYKLRDVFSFKGKIISAYGQDFSMSDVFAHFARSHDHFTLEQLNSLKRDLDTPIYFDSVYANSLRINQDEFVSRDREVFDVTATDAAIDRFCDGDYIALKEISFFGSFPNAGFPWNGFLLEHYVSDFSRKYKLMHIGFTASTPIGAIVKRDSNYETFDELLITVLAASNILLNEQNALQYLLDAGLIARRYYGGIQQVLTKAKLRRAQKG